MKDEEVFLIKISKNKFKNNLKLKNNKKINKFKFNNT